MTRKSLKISINFAKSMQTARSVLNACCLRATRLRGEILPERKDQLAHARNPSCAPLHSPTVDAVPTSRRKPLARFHDGDCQHKRTPVHCIGVTAVGSRVEIEINDDRYDNEGSRVAAVSEVVRQTGDGAIYGSLCGWTLLLRPNPVTAG